VLWLVNFLLDLVLLAGTARFGAFATTWLRLVLTAAFGGLYGVGLVFPRLAVLYVFPMPIIFSLLMLAAAFGRLSRRRFLRLVGCFYLLSFAMGGVVIGVRALLGQSMLAGVSAFWLVFAMLPAVCLGALGVGAFRRALGRSGLQVRAEIRFGGKRVALPCFLDTGNCLREPVHGRPVLLAELSGVDNILPSELAQGLQEVYEVKKKSGERVRPYQLLLDCRKYDWGERLLLIPYASVCTGSVGADSGLLLGFVPDDVSFCLPNGTRRCPSEQPVLALYPQSLRGLQGCRALVHPDCVFGELICDGINENGNMDEMGEMEGRLGA
jgi:stage II sporulation protein GA (sporulation sigma-E factor processing peptidase)